MAHHPDFSSTDDEFDEADGDYYEFKKRIEELRSEDKHNSEQTDVYSKEQKLRKIYFSIINGNLDSVIEDLNEGLDVNLILEHDWNPILLASSVSNFNIIEALLDKGADVKSTRDGYTTLMLACNCPNETSPFRETTKIVQRFLELGVDPNAINRKRMTAIMFAANNGNLDTVKILLPVSDKTSEDNQKWTVLFWAINGGNIDTVKFLMENGFDSDKVDVRNNTPYDIARELDIEGILQLFPQNATDEIDFVINNYNSDFQSIFDTLKNGEKPQFFLDICSILYGTRNECLIKLFADKDIKLQQLLSVCESDLIELGVKLPYQRHRLLGGVYRFHKHTFNPKSLPTIEKNKLYSNVDAAEAVLTAVKQIIAMEASLDFIMKNGDIKSMSQRENLLVTIKNIRKKIRSLQVVSSKLTEKASKWDAEIAPVDHITKSDGKRWFPWRKTIIGLSVTILILHKCKVHLFYKL